MARSFAAADARRLLAYHRDLKAELIRAEAEYQALKDEVKAAVMVGHEP